MQTKRVIVEADDIESILDEVALIYGRKIFTQSFE